MEILECFDCKSYKYLPLNNRCKSCLKEVNIRTVVAVGFFDNKTPLKEIANRLNTQTRKNGDKLFISLNGEADASLSNDGSFEAWGNSLSMAENKAIKLENKLKNIGVSSIYDDISDVCGRISVGKLDFEDVTDKIESDDKLYIDDVSEDYVKCKVNRRDELFITIRDYGHIDVHWADSVSDLEKVFDMVIGSISN